jgi:four helix bundle protein
MKYRRFEELPVWKDAIELARQVFELLAAGRLKRDPGRRDQLERAVVSISNNIAKGFERGTNEELLTFLSIARGSTGEVRSMLHLLERSSISWSGSSRAIRLRPRRKSPPVSRQPMASPVNSAVGSSPSRIPNTEEPDRGRPLFAKRKRMAAVETTSSRS